MTEDSWSDRESFLTDVRHSFFWEHTYPHISQEHNEQIQFFKLLPSFIDIYLGRDVLLSTLRADNELIDRLKGYLDRSFFDYDERKPSSNPIAREIFQLVTYLSEGMFASEVEHYGDGNQEAVARTSPRLLRVIGVVSRIAEIDGLAQLPARLCLASVRRALLTLCQKASTEMLNLQEEEVSAFFRRIYRMNFKLGGRHPSAILLLLVSGTYSGYRWERANESKLLPLHDDDCCRGWKSVMTPKGRAHVSACNVLTIVAHILQSTDEQRQFAESSLYEALKDARRQLQFVMPEDDRMRIPSPEFVNVLRSAGLEEWFEPESIFETEPRDGSHYEFLTTRDGFDCVNILRELAKRVNFEAYFEHAAAAQRPPMALPSLGNNNPEHPHLAQTVADVSDDSESTSPRSARTSTIHGIVEDVHDLPADSEHRESALAVGNDAATGSYGGQHEGSGNAVDRIEPEQGLATMAAAQILGERGEDETNGAGAAELETVIIAHDRDAHTENREASDEAAPNAGARTDIDIDARPRSGLRDVDDV